MSNSAKSCQLYPFLFVSLELYAGLSQYVDRVLGIHVFTVVVVVVCVCVCERERDYERVCVDVQCTCTYVLYVCIKRG